MNKILWAVITLLVAGGAYYYLTMQKSAPASPSGANTENAMTYSSSDFAWKVTNAPNFEETMPYHRLALEVKGKSYTVQGDEAYMGCAPNMEWRREANELSKVVCWWGGGGHELGVFFEGGKYVVKERWIQESGGPEVEAPPFGPWKVLLEIL